jgi:hypothetical protein
MSGIFRAIGDEFRNRLSQEDTIPVNTYEGCTNLATDVTATAQ